MFFKKDNKFNRLAILLIASFMVFVGLGCKGMSQKEMEATKPVVLNYWTVYDDVAQLRELAKAYKEQRPYVNINIRQVRYEEFDKLFANALADDVAPDLVSMHSRWIRQYQNRLDTMPASVNVTNIQVKGQLKKETIITIDNNVMPTKNAIKRDYVSTVAKDVIIGDKIYGLPVAMDTMAMYYNKELLDKAGIPLPPHTWVEFTEAIKKTSRFTSDGEILQSGVAMGTGKNIDNAFDLISLLFLQNGVMMESGGRPVFAAKLDDRNPNMPIYEAMRFYTDFARPTKDVYSWNEKMDNALEEFARGKSVFFFGFAYDRQRIKARGPQIKLEVEPVPQLNSAVPVNVANYWVESVVLKSKHKNEAWDFIRFMSEPANIKKYVTATKQPSPLRTQIVEQQEDPELGPFATQALTAQNWYSGKNIEATKQAFNDLFTRYLEPYTNDIENLGRNMGLIRNAESVVAQTY